MDPLGLVPSAAVPSATILPEGGGRRHRQAGRRGRDAVLWTAGPADTLRSFRTDQTNARDAVAKTAAEQLKIIESGIEELLPREEFEERLERSIREGRPLRIKQGFD